VDTAQFKARVDQIHRDLDRYNYYELLNLPAAAGYDDIRRAFHRMARTLHPDRYHKAADASMRDKVYVIYKRIAEGYRVLMDHEARREYDEGLSKGNKRLVKTDRPQKVLKQTGSDIEPPQARKFFILGKDAERRGDKKSARMNYKFAQDLAGDHPAIVERIKALEQGE